MRCLLVVPSGWAYPHLSSGLQALGVECERFLLSYSMARECWSDFGRSQHRRNLDLQRLASHPKLRPDLVVFVTYDDCLEVDTLKVMRRQGIRTVCLHVDMVSQWYRILRTGPYFDLVWCAQKANIEKLCSRGIRAFFMPMAAMEKDSPPFEAVDEVRYIGAPQPFRLSMLKKATTLAPLGIYGRWFQSGFTEPPLPVDQIGKAMKMVWDLKYFLPKIQTRQIGLGRRRGYSNRVNREFFRSYWRGELTDAEIPSTVASARLNLGFTYMSGEPFSSTERRQCRLREFEMPLFCVNGPYLTQRFDELDELYKADEEILVWNTLEEFEDKIKQVFSNPQWAREVARKGREKVRSQHLWQHRFKMVFEMLHL